MYVCVLGGGGEGREGAVVIKKSISQNKAAKRIQHTVTRL